MRIDINDKYCITSDVDQFKVCTKGTYKSNQKGTDTKEGAKTGDELLTIVGYLSTIDQCFRYLIQRQIRESSAVGFKEIMAEVDRIEKELKEVIRI